MYHVYHLYLPDWKGWPYVEGVLWRPLVHVPCRGCVSLSVVFGPSCYPAGGLVGEAPSVTGCEAQPQLL